MRSMLINDLRIGAWKSYCEQNDIGRDLRILDVTEELRRLRVLAKRNNIEMLIILGDIFKAKDGLDVIVLNNIFLALKSFVDSGIRVVLIVGRHDRADVGNHHALEIFRPFCDVVDVPKVFSFSNGGDILAIPYYDNVSVVKKAIRRFVTDNTRLICANVAIRGQQWLGGDAWNEGLELTAFPQHTKVVLGYARCYCEVDAGRVFYLGSLLQDGYDDGGHEKYFGVYNNVTNKLSFFKTDGPKFETIDIVSLEDTVFSDLRQRIVGNYVRINTVPPGIAEYSRIVQKVREYGARHVELNLTASQDFVPPLDANAQALGINHDEILRRYIGDVRVSTDREVLVDAEPQTVEHVVDVDGGITKRVGRVITRIIEVEQ